VSDAVVVRAFNDAINARDVDRLATLMTHTHRFIDSAGSTVEGKAACLDAWRGFFDAFPDYRNVFDSVEDVGGGVVVVRGRSECSVDALHGPAMWRAAVREGLVDVWQVIDLSTE
jgi:ketosteroid isomerase-like protein